MTDIAQTIWLMLDRAWPRRCRCGSPITWRAPRSASCFDCRSDELERELAGLEWKCVACGRMVTAAQSLFPCRCRDNQLGYEIRHVYGVLKSGEKARVKW